MKKILGTLIILVLIILGIKSILPKLSRQSSSAKLNSNAYYAVFLSNNQVYFGRLDNVSDQYVRMTDIYYLQLAKPLQSTDQSGKVDLEEDKDKAKSQLTLIKLGKEMHGPQDQMNINRDQVLFYEELKDDSKVVQAIQKDKDGQK